MLLKPLGVFDPSRTFQDGDNRKTGKGEHTIEDSPEPDETIENLQLKTPKGCSSDQFSTDKPRQNADAIEGEDALYREARVLRSLAQKLL